MDEGILTWYKILVAWYHNTEQCSIYSHDLMYAVLTMTVAFPLIGVYVWFRFIKTKPVTKNGVPVESVEFPNTEVFVQ